VDACWYSEDAVAWHLGLGDFGPRDRVVEYRLHSGVNATSMGLGRMTRIAQSGYNGGGGPFCAIPHLRFGSDADGGMTTCFVLWDHSHAMPQDLVAFRLPFGCLAAGSLSIGA
jgi:hypothetical protein